MSLLAGGLGAQDIAELDHLAIGIGDLDTDGALAGDRCEQADLVGGHRVGDVLLQPSDTRDVNAPTTVDFVAGHLGTTRVAGDRGVHIELGEDVLQRLDDGVVGRSAGGVPRTGAKQGVLGQRIGGAVGQRHVAHSDLVGEVGLLKRNLGGLLSNGVEAGRRRWIGSLRRKRLALCPYRRSSRPALGRRRDRGARRRHRLFLVAHLWDGEGDVGTIIARVEELGDRGLLGCAISGALTPAASALARCGLLRLQCGTEGLVTVIGVQARGLLHVTGSAGCATYPPQEAAGQGVCGAAGVGRGIGSVNVTGVEGTTLLQQVADLGDGPAVQDQGGEHGQEDEQDEGPHRGEQCRQRIAHKPPQQSAGALQPSDVVPQNRVAAAHLDHAGQCGQQAQAAHRSPRVDRSQAVDPQHGDPQRS